MGLGKRGYFFSIDALLGLMIILAVILIIRPQAHYVNYESRVHDDFLRTLSDLKVGDLNTTYAKQLKANYTITKLNMSVLEAIGDLYAVGDPAAKYLAQEIIDDLQLNENIALYYDTALIANNSVVDLSNSTRVRTSRYLISGIRGGVNASSGFSSRAFLYSENKVKYFYFGGYVGDGNVTVNLGENVASAKVEADIYGNFSLYINDLFVDNYVPTPGTPYVIDLSDQGNKFSVGSNNISFRSNESLSIAGGHVRIVYNESGLSNGYNYLPGIEGFINLYDGFYIPGNLTNLSLFLHYNSSYDIVMKIGDVEVYSGNGSDVSVFRNNATLGGLLNYTLLSQNTVPIRIGLLNVTDIEGTQRESDVYSVTDLSGSMGDCGQYTEPLDCNYWCATGFFSGSWKSCNVAQESDCSGNVCGGGGCWWTNSHYLDCGKTLLDLAKEANRAFLDVVLNYTGNRVGLVGYENSVSAGDTHSLSNDTTSLNSTINSWIDGGSTCICCGINEAASRLITENETGKVLSMVVMSDGEANVECAQQGVTPDLDGNGVADEGPDDAIQAACDAYNNYGIVVYSVGFMTSSLGTDALEAIASCGQGTYYNGDVDNLVEIYRLIAENILVAAYDEQKLVGNGSVMTLYPDSKIIYEYDIGEVPYGMEITSESSEFGNLISEGTFDIPLDAQLIEVNVISYSGAKWTNLVEVNTTSGWEVVFNLSDYGLDYTELGDPYVFNIPVGKIVTGENKIRVRTASESDNQSGGSPDNMIIYTIVKDIAAYSDVLASASGCTWHIAIEGGGNATIKVPSNYSDADVCYFAPDDYFFPGSNVVLANSQSAVNNAILNLLEALDLNNNYLVEVNLTESDLNVNSIEIEGLPFVETMEVQTRLWH